MPMRIEVSSGAGSVPAAADAVEALEGAADGVAVPPPLAARHRVIAFDQRGTGATPPSAGKYSTRLFAADALGLLDALDVEPAHVVGHSMGGRVAQWMALERPDRVRSLVLAATGPGQFREDRPVTRGVPVH